MSAPEEFIPPSIEEIAKLLPAYEINSFIAKGGMGAVYMARQKSLDRLVAIKILPRKFGEDKMFRESFEQEAKSMAKFNHPNLVSIYDFGQIDGMLYFIMEMVQGKPLYYSCYGKKIDPNEANRITVEICNGLHHAHKHGILHRDIKPANILLDPSVTPKIGDFGLARKVEDHASDQAFGTPGYTAPEVVNNPTAVKECTDIYSVGVMLYELLTSKTPETPYIPVTSIIKCHPSYDKIILKAIHPTPSMRYQSAEEMSDELKKIAKSDPNSPFVNKRSPKKPKLTAATPSPSAVFSNNTAKASLVPTKSLATRSVITSPITSRQPQNSTHQADFVTGNSAFTRNIIIIIVLLGCIIAAWQGLKVVKAEREAENQHIKDLNSQKNKTAAFTTEQNTPDKNALNTAAAKTNLPTATPLASLDDLKAQLLRGLRIQMPQGTISRNGRSRFFIEKKMSWYDAKHYCESYGGHLAVLPKAVDISSLSTKIKPNETIWVGAGSAGDSNWQWIDGSEWIHEIRSSSKLTFLTLNKFGILSPTPPAQKHSFYIEWFDDGKTPATLTNQLKRTAKSINTADHNYPAGTVSYDGRYYLLIPEILSWNDASNLATISGGQLAVPSTSYENEWLLDFIASKTDSDEACWIGGLCKNGEDWEWITGEPWTFATWKSSNLKANTSSVYGCAITANKEWSDYEATQALPYTLIEWSNDHQNIEPVDKPKTENNNKVQEARTKCAQLIQAITAKHEPVFTSNSKGLIQDIQSYQSPLTREAREKIRPIVDELIQGIENNRIASNIQGAPPKNLAEIYKKRLKRQDEIQAKMLTEIEKTRLKYVDHLKKIGQGYKDKGQKSNAQNAQNEIDRANKYKRQFNKYITKS